MSEQIPTQGPEQQELRFEINGRVLGINEDTSPLVPSFDDEDIEQWWRDRERAELDARPAGPGLKRYDLDMDLFQWSTDLTQLTSAAPDFTDTLREVMDLYYETSPEDRPGDYLEESPDQHAALLFSTAAMSGPTERLGEWLGERTLLKTDTSRRKW